MGIDTESHRPAPFPAKVAEQIDALPRTEAAAWPEAVGRRIGIPQR
ncbi:hypothetical protein [Billgrantia zhangzhouensis]